MIHHSKDVRFAYKRSIRSPFLLIMEDGEPFCSWVFYERNAFKTCYFSLVSINEEHHCVWLELLVPCCTRATCSRKVLYRSSSRILVDLSCICGITQVGLPVYDALILKNIQTHRLHFCLSTTSHSIDVWRNGTTCPNTATIVLCHQGNQDVPITISIQTKKGCHFLSVKKGESRSITLENIMLISKEKSLEHVEAILEIQLHVVKRRKIKL
ncbi:CotZ-related putative spore coat protein [Bacillus sp. 179-C3.3 HS]|uniref:CotZ-related putative spore coat protein n=1 Tax=Bacillus sp. 179-C3.3 HS TaxID=3232162 RepID=UPI00399FF3C3